MLNKEYFIRFLLPFAATILITSGCRDQGPAESSGPPGSHVGALLAQMPAFPYGGVYFRKSNPPEEDWERDYQTAAGLGVNVFRHWFLWSSIEVEPGRYDWSDYDRQMDLAEKNNIKTVIKCM